MKIGILTYHRSHNYGALLQAIATRIVLEKIGHNVYYVDYWPGYHKRMYALFNIRGVIRKNPISSARYIYNFIRTYNIKKERRKKMNQFISQYIEPYCKSMSDEFDILVYGSDQIWRKQPEGIGYNPVYFGVHNIKTKKHVSYAASMGILPTTDQDKLYIKKLVSNIDSISVREQDLAHLLHDLEFKNVNVCLDPTLLITSEQWLSIFNIKNSSDNKYVLYYCLQPNAFSLQEIESFAKKRNLSLKVIIADYKEKESEKYISTSAPDKFIELFSNAEFVFTSSFHGLVFSIIFNKPFYASFQSNSGRAQSLLDYLELSGYLLPAQSKINEDYNYIDYKEVNNRLERFRSNSLNYLQENLIL